jgi:hypothetical protein
MSEQQRSRRRRQRQRRRQRRREDGDAPEISGDADAIEGEVVNTAEDKSRLGDPVVKRKGPPATIFGMPRMIFLMSAGITVAILMVIIINQVAPPSDAVEGVTQFPDQGRRHLVEGEVFTAYNSDPATSGPQDPLGVPPGKYGPDEAAPFDFVPSDAQLLPVLEAGGLVIHYDPASLSDLQTEQLQDFLDLAATATPNVVLTADTGLAAPIIATAWTHHFTLDELDDDFIDDLAKFVLDRDESFYQRFVLERNPETIDLRTVTINAE